MNARGRGKSSASNIRSKRFGKAAEDNPTAAAMARMCSVAAAEIARLMPLWPWEQEVDGGAAQLRLLNRLRRALREERHRGVAGHWSYDLARHAQLVAAYRAELQRYLKMRVGGD